MTTFQGVFRVTPDLVGGNLFIPGHSNNNSRISETDSSDPETETGNLETEKRVHRIHGTLETGLQRMLRSLVATTRGAGGFIFFHKLFDRNSFQPDGVRSLYLPARVFAYLNIRRTQNA